MCVYIYICVCVCEKSNLVCRFLRFHNRRETVSLKVTFTVGMSKQFSPHTHTHNHTDTHTHTQQHSHTHTHTHTHNTHTQTHTHKQKRQVTLSGRSEQANPRRYTDT